MTDSKGVNKACGRSLFRFLDKNFVPVSLPSTEEQLKGVFKRYDTDGDGRLSNQELKAAFNSLGSRFPAWRAWRGRCHADSNGDGYISEGEFDALVNYVVKKGFAKK